MPEEAPTASEADVGVGVGVAPEADAALRTAEVVTALDSEVGGGGVEVEVEVEAEVEVAIGAELSAEAASAELSDEATVLVLQFPGEIPATLGAHSPTAGGASGFGVEVEGENARTIVLAFEDKAEQAQGSAFC